MSLLVILAIIGVILLFVGGFVATLKFLLWIGILLVVVAVIVWLVRSMSGHNSNV